MNATAPGRAGGPPATPRQLVAETLGTALLLLVVVGSGIATSQDGASSTQLFQHAVVVGLALVALVHTFLDVSGAHLNPAVTLVDVVVGGRSLRSAGGYVAAQVVGACAGVVLANVLFDAPAVALATTVRGGPPLLLSEVVATAGLVLVIHGTVRSGRIAAVPGVVGAYVAAAIFATSSASFANPAVTLARTLSDTWTGIAPGGVPGFVAAQVTGALTVALLVRWLFAPERSADTSPPTAPDALPGVEHPDPVPAASEPS